MPVGSSTGEKKLGKKSRVAVATLLPGLRWLRPLKNPPIYLTVIPGKKKLGKKSRVAIATLLQSPEGV